MVENSSRKSLFTPISDKALPPSDYFIKVKKNIILKGE